MSHSGLCRLRLYCSGLCRIQDYVEFGLMSLEIMSFRLMPFRFMLIGFMSFSIMSFSILLVYPSSPGGIHYRFVWRCFPLLGLKLKFSCVDVFLNLIILLKATVQR